MGGKAEAGAQPRLGRLFVSSVFGGESVGVPMLDLRGEIEAAAEMLGFECPRSEGLVAGGADVHAVLEREIANCDTYVGVFSARRGTVPEGEHRAITEQEFELARRYGLRCLVFVDAAAEAARDPALEAFLKDDVYAYRHGVYPRRYASEEELRLA